MSNEYNTLVSDILDNEEFNKLKQIKHHGITRYDHCLRVSYYSYKVSKFFHLDYKAASRAGLLHDFFLDTYNKNRLHLLINHPKIALENSKKYFTISKKEENIIKSHMFPVSLPIPTHFESWIVCISDDIAAIKERLSFKKQN